MTPYAPLSNSSRSRLPLPLAWKGVLALSLLLPISVLASTLEEQAIDLVNQERIEAGLSPVRESALLRQAAEAKAADMLKNDYFAHTSPKGDNPWYWLKQVGYNYKAAGENLAINYEDAKDQHKAWMKSTTHRANIMNSHFQEIGMATRQGRLNGKNATITVQLFGTPRSAQAAKTPQPLQETPRQAVQGIQTLPQLIQIQTTPPKLERTAQPLAPILINPSLGERIYQSPFIADYGWLTWTETVATSLLYLLAVILPLTFLITAGQRLKSTWELRVTEHQGV